MLEGEPGIRGQWKWTVSLMATDTAAEVEVTSWPHRAGVLVTSPSGPRAHPCMKESLKEDMRCLVSSDGSRTHSAACGGPPESESWGEVPSGGRHKAPGWGGAQGGAITGEKARD